MRPLGLNWAWNLASEVYCGILCSWPEHTRRVIDFSSRDDESQKQHLQQKYLRVNARCFSISVAYYISKIKWLNIFIAPLIFYISFVCLRCSFSLHQFPRVPLPPFVYSIHSEGIREAEKWEAGYSRGRARTKHDNSAIFFWQRNCCRESTLWKWRKWYNFHIFRPSEKVLFVVG